jgi:replicative DNA helicase
MPLSVEAEQQVLGEMLLTNCEGAGYNAALRAGGASLFFDPVHQRLFEACHKKAMQGFLVSTVTVADVTRDDQGLKELGGPAYLVRMAGSVMAGGQHYVAMLADLKRKRELIQTMNEAQAAIAQGEDADVIAARIEASLINADPVGQSRPVSLAQALTGASDLIVKAYQGDDGGRLRTGLGALDSIVPGFYPGELNRLLVTMRKDSWTADLGEIRVARCQKSELISEFGVVPSSCSSFNALSSQRSSSGLFGKRL